MNFEEWWANQKIEAGTGIMTQTLKELAQSAWTASEPVAPAKILEAIMGAKLPSHFQWGSDAMEQFEFGKKRAADAVSELLHCGFAAPTQETR